MSPSGCRPSTVRRPRSCRVPRDSVRSRLLSQRHVVARSETPPVRGSHTARQCGFASEVADAGSGDRITRCQSVDTNLSRSRGQTARDCAQERRLAGPVGADDACRLARGEIEREFLKDEPTAVLHREVTDRDGQRHWEASSGTSRCAIHLQGRSPSRRWRESTPGQRP